MQYDPQQVQAIQMVVDKAVREAFEAGRASAQRGDDRNQAALAERRVLQDVHNEGRSRGIPLAG